MNNFAKNTKGATKNLLMPTFDPVQNQSERLLPEKIVNGKELLKSFQGLNLSVMTFLLKTFCKVNWVIATF
jgi:hypothetical protein